ncbi:ribokinase [Phytoactinopolyspora halotolerans]|uniref:Ribokinase n=1 Tax=Phytoactinopolyspora halotolerans TaxID=1981512 RepID=A0A6L9S8N2_9ACTN|nr:ribokinase [Phytoactinopolyspora halotolerans]NEE00954.1 ribokinase [Phytoactinopolyspora halotolerans]
MSGETPSERSGRLPGWVGGDRAEPSAERARSRARPGELSGETPRRTGIAVLGSANMDLVVTTERAPERGETVTGQTFRTIPGGKGANQALAAARAGGSVRFLGAVGDDEFGRQIRTVLGGDGVDTGGLISADEPTGTAHIVVDGDGDNSIVVVPGANGTVTALTDAHRTAIESVGTLLLQLELPLSVVAEAAAFARSVGVRTVLTPAPAVPLPDELLGEIDLLVPNEHEAAILTGGHGAGARGGGRGRVAAHAPAPPPAPAPTPGTGAGTGDDVTDDSWSLARQLAKRSRAVTVTLGSRGAIHLAEGAAPVHVPAFAVDAVDSTAAGDTFVGVLAVGLAEDLPIDDALRRASAAAAISVQRFGASSSMPTRAEIDSFLLDRTR